MSDPTMALVERIRSSGKFPPALWKNDLQVLESKSTDNFTAKVLEVLISADPTSGSLSLSSDPSTTHNFQSLLKMSSRDFMTMTKEQIEMRRAILLTIVGATPTESRTLKNIMEEGYLFTVKSWLEDIQNGSVGTVDLLLHLLSSIMHLPVTKTLVADSRLGKAVVAVGNHSICVGHPSESTIKERIGLVKDRWKKQLKTSKGEDDSDKKRAIDNGSSYNNLSGSSSKKPKLGNPKSAAEIAREKAKERNEAEKARLASLNPIPPVGGGRDSPPNPAEGGSTSSKVKARRGKTISWADSGSGQLAQVYESNHGYSDNNYNAAKGKSDTSFEIMMASSNRTTWRKPKPLNISPPAQVSSNELMKQATRIASVRQVQYLSDKDVPISPQALSDIEQALEITSQASTIAEIIPFFGPKQPPPQPKTNIITNNNPPPVSTSVSNLPVVQPHHQTHQQQQQHSYHQPQQQQMMQNNLVPPPPPPRGGVMNMNSSSTGGFNNQGATMEVVQSMGLPLFLVGQNVQALQALTPNLLSTFVDASGMYDQARLLTLVQALSQNLGGQPTNTHTSQPNMYGNTNTNQYQQNNGMMNMGATSNTTGYHNSYQQQTQSSPYAPQASNTYGNNNNRMQQQTYGKDTLPGVPPAAPNGYRGDQNGSEANLHLSGYGPSTTQSDIIQLFAPYVHVAEVVTKNGFSFVNTRDPAGAKRAREALNGAILGGGTVRINIATRRAPDPNQMRGGGGGGDGRHNNHRNNNIRTDTLNLPRNPLTGQVDYDAVRDDRGNPATKNLFVAGYGAGTTEQELRALFSQQAQVTGSVMKGTFAFINTSDKSTAVQVRIALTGTIVNGGPLRINFAKESGRLGTSFDQTYGPSGKSPYMRR